MARDFVLLSIPTASTRESAKGDGATGLSTPSPLNLATQDVDFQTFATHAAELARILTGATGSAIAFREKEGTICRARSGQGAPRIGAPVDTTSGISKQCLDSGALLYCADTATDTRIDAAAARALGIRAVAVAPIRSNGEDGEITGILEVFSSTPGIFTDRHLKTLHHVAILIGSAARAPLPSATAIGDFAGQPELALLIEREPALLGFFRNLATVLSPRRASKVSSILQEEWRYVVVDPRVPWRRFFQSVLLHVTVIGTVVGLARIWPREISLQPPRRYEHITYYPFSGAAPVVAENHPAARPAHRRAPAQGQSRTSAASEGASKISAGNEAQPAASVPPAPGTQGVAIRGPQLPVAAAVPPPPGLEPATRQQPHMPSVTVVAPPPDLAGGSGSREISGPATGVIPPPPEARGLTNRAGLAAGYGGSTRAASVVPPPPSIAGRAGLARSGGGVSNREAKVIGPPPSIQGGAGGRGRPTMALGGAIEVVPPPPSLQGTGSYGGGGQIGSLGGSGSQVVPPPPSLQGTGGNGRGQRVGSLGDSGSGVVPPPPSLQGAGGSGGGERIGTLGGGSGSQIVPPPPSVQGAGGLGGGGTRVGSLGGSGSQVVPPPPSLRGTGARGGGGNGIGSLAGSGSGIVPPPPSVGNGMGSGLGGKGANGLAGMGSGVVPPPPSVDGGGNGVGGGRGGSLPHVSAEVEAPAGSGNGTGSANAAADIPTTPVTPPAESQTQPTFQNVQLRVIFSAWAPPRSSYFSNYEVFIAQKWLNKETPQLIKLVYVFLPYQRRLSQYSAEGWKVRKLRVVRDPSCDESLMQIEWPEGVDNSAKSKQPGSVGEKPPDRDRPLPCYRTTADDYRRAISSR